MAKDYYAILGVSRTASPEEIKKAYRKKALEHHPDRAGKASETKFKEINEAYQVLSNPEKRQTYDQFGTTEGFSRGGPGGAGANINWDDLFGGRRGGFGFGNLNDLFENVMGEAMSQVQVELPVKLTDILLGGEIRFRAPTNEELSLAIPAGSPPGTTFRFPGKGGSHRRGRGDLYVTLRLDFPRRLTKDQEELLKQLQTKGL